MNTMDLVNDCQQVKDVIISQATMDERAFASLSVLEERLEKVRMLGGRFSRIGFSSEVKQLVRQKELVAV